MVGYFFEQFVLKGFLFYNGIFIQNSVELFFPSEYEELIIAYAESRHEPTKSVYGWVPVGVVTTVLAKHGGMIDGTVPEGVAPLKGSESD